MDKVLYPELNLTKAQVIEYYVKMASKLLDLLPKRPLVLTRFPDGVDKKGFYEKDTPVGTPPWVNVFKEYSETSQRVINYILCDDLDTVVWLANLAALEIHMALFTTNSPENPDLIFFDLDPESPATFDDVVDVALLLKEKMDKMGLRTYVKTSGKKGLHVIIPIVKGYTFGQTREFVHQTGKYLARENPVVVSESTRSKAPGTVFIDYVQNSHSRTMVCPYSLRATPKATVSTPLEWSDVKKGIKPEEFNLFSVVKLRKSPWEGLFENRQKLGD